MRILLITEAFGGIATYSEFLLRELNKIKGIESKVTWLFYPQNYQKENIKEFIPQTRTVLNLPSSHSFKDPLMKIIRQDPSGIVN